MVAPIDDEERTNAAGLFNTARSYWRSAEHLNVANLKVTHPQAPVTFMFCHAIELYLKAHLRSTGAKVAELKRLSHRVAELANAAEAKGLKLEPEQSEILSHIQEEDVALESRYIVTGFKNRPTNEALALVVEALDKSVCAALMAHGLPVRAEAFQKPEPPRKDELDETAQRILSHLFCMHDRDHREERVMAKVLGLDGGMLKYHLERLAALGLAETAGANYRFGYVYWAPTAEGRKYLVERKLVG